MYYKAVIFKPFFLQQISFTSPCYGCGSNSTFCL